MQHSLLRKRNESVKIFSHKDEGSASGILKVYKFTLTYGLEDITPAYIVNDLNTDYYSTEITTPSDNCYLLIMFNDKPIVFRVGTPHLQFFYWSARNEVIDYKHYNEDGDLKSEGTLKQLNYGFYYYTPVEELLGYIEVKDKPYVLNVPYSIEGITVGVTAVIDWNKKVLKQEFGILTNKLGFDLRTQKLGFDINTSYRTFDTKIKLNTFNTKVIKQDFTNITTDGEVIYVSNPYSEYICSLYTEQYLFPSNNLYPQGVL